MKINIDFRLLLFLLLIIIAYRKICQRWIKTFSKKGYHEQLKVLYTFYTKVKIFTYKFNTETSLPPDMIRKNVTKIKFMCCTFQDSNT